MSIFNGVAGLRVSDIEEAIKNRAESPETISASRRLIDRIKELIKAGDFRSTYHGPESYTLLFTLTQYDVVNQQIVDYVNGEFKKTKVFEYHSIYLSVDNPQKLSLHIGP